LALDEDDRQLEAVKLCIEYLKHLTTLSGAGTVVVLTLMERRGANLLHLAIPAFFFGVATVVCLLGMYYLIAGVAHNDLDRADTGVLFVAGVSGMFVVAIVSLMAGPLNLPEWVRFAIGVLIMAAGAAGLGYLRYRKRDTPE
jgi:hypothetical protein